MPGFLQDIQLTDNPLAPKAHLNYLFFDSKLQLVPSLSGSIQVQGGGTTGWQNSGSVTIGPGAVGNNVIQPAYVIIYVDNQTIGKNVWFDNVHVEHYTSKLLEEDHYYPFGLTVGITQAAQSNLPAQPYKLTGKELEPAFGLNAYDFGARMQDMQLGRWWSVDPLAGKYYSYSPYNFCMDNPVKYFDPNGKETWINYGKDQRVEYKDGKLYNKDGSAYSGKVNGFLSKVFDALNKISTSKTGKEMLDALSTSKNVFDIKDVSNNPKGENQFVPDNTPRAYAEKIKSNQSLISNYEKNGVDISGGAGGTIYWNSKGSDLNTTSGVRRSAETDLAHELTHGYDANRGLMNDNQRNAVQENEYNASYRENLIRGELNRPLRTSYGGFDSSGNSISVPLLDSKSKPILPPEYKP